MRRFYDTELANGLMLGTAQYPSPAILEAAFQSSKPAVATVSLRREGRDGGGQPFWDIIRALGVHILPNTAGCHNVKEAVTTAHMAQEVFETDWIKLEVIGDTDSLQPDVFGLVEAARILCDDGFKVFPYCTEDLPWGAPIGSGMGLNNEYGLRALRARFPDIPMVIDAGIGLPSHAARAMELGFDAVLLNTAVAKAGDPEQMAVAMAEAVIAGQRAANADPMEPRDMASPSTPVIGQAFLS